MLKDAPTVGYTVLNSMQNAVGPLKDNNAIRGM